jgi:hypothetical protein
MKELFLRIDGISSVTDARTWSINAALQHNRIYEDDENEQVRWEFRSEWGRLLEIEAEPYKNPPQPISDSQHCDAIQRIADALAARFSNILFENKVRFGTSQKAFNLYLKYLWAMNEIATPPHIPIDSWILRKAGLEGCWTKSDSREDYMGWINHIRNRLNLAEWENEAWLRRRLSEDGI